MTVINTEQYIDEILKRSPEKQKKAAKAPEFEGICEKKTKQLISGIQRKIDSLRQQGREATCEVSESDNVIEIRVTVTK